MNAQQISIGYAHCVKFTAGQLDRAPWSAYEWRVVRAEVEDVGDEFLSPAWVVRLGGRIIGDGDTAEEAIGQAEYRLMDHSRTAMEEHENSKHQIAQAI